MAHQQPGVCRLARQLVGDGKIPEADQQKQRVRPNLRGEGYVQIRKSGQTRNQEKLTTGDPIRRVT